MGENDLFFQIQKIDIHNYKKISNSKRKYIQ